MAEAANIWDKIQQGLKETERLIAQKQYNLAMVRSRQTLEYMVKSLGARACIIDGDLSDTIDQLYDGQWITKTTKDRYHKLRMIGNKAVHEGNDNPADAEQAYRILADEFYTFANNYNPNRSRTQRPSPSRPKNGASPARKRKKRRKAPALGIAGILLPVLLVIVLSIFIVRLLVPEKDQKETAPPETTSAVMTDVETTPPETEPTTTAEETEPTTEETTTSAVYKTTSTLNVRSRPSTDSRILAQLAPGEEVTVIGVHDQQWSIISYNGQDAYVATAYLTQ